MILLKYVYNVRVQPRKNEDGMKIIMVTGEKIAMMKQRSTVDSRCHLTNFKMLVSQSMSAILRQSI